MSLMFGKGIPIKTTDLQSSLGKSMPSDILPLHTQNSKAPFDSRAAFRYFLIRSSEESLDSEKHFLVLLSLFLS